MKFKTALLGFIGSVVVAASAHAETPVFAAGSAPSLLGHSSDWTAVSFSALSKVGSAVFAYELLSEQTSAVKSQSFSVNGKTVFAGAATTGATASSAGATTFASFAFDSNVGGAHHVSSLTGNTPTVDHSGEYQIYQSNANPNTFVLAYEDDFRSRSGSGDYNDMVVRLTVAAVPEPETYAMMLAGLGAVAFLGSRRRRAA